MRIVQSIYWKAGEVQNQNHIEAKHKLAQFKNLPIKISHSQHSSQDDIDHWFCLQLDLQK